jgi:hypothetical protein
LSTGFSSLGKKGEERETKQCERFPPPCTGQLSLCSSLQGAKAKPYKSNWIVDWCLVPYMRMHPRKMEKFTFLVQVHAYLQFCICRGKVAVGAVCFKCGKKILQLGIIGISAD